MHFALPPRKSEQPPPFARVHAQSAANARRRVLRLLSYAIGGILSVYLVFHYVFTLSSGLSSKNISTEIPPNQDILLVTVLDDSLSDNYVSMIRRNRDDYAQRHNYKTFYTNTSTYNDLISPAPSSWALVPALRHALKLHPEVNYIWSLTPHALITNPSCDLHTHILANLSSLMLHSIPVVPPDSVIHTFPHTTPQDAHLILSQDMENLAHTSFLLKNTVEDPTDNWAHYMLDAWFDPLYRAYSFHLADLHALEHLVQWHNTITSHLALIPQRYINSYNFETPPGKIPLPDGQFMKDEHGDDVLREHDAMWAEGDLVVNFKACDEFRAKEQGRDCEKEMSAYFRRWEREVRRLDEGILEGQDGS